MKICKMVKITKKYICVETLTVHPSRKKKPLHAETWVSDERV